MKFDNNAPARDIDDEVRFSVFAAVNYLAKSLNINEEKLLIVIENCNRIVISLITNVLLSSTVIISSTVTHFGVLSYLISYLSSYGITLFIEVLTKKIYQPRFYSRTNMNLADVINKISGPNQNWDIVDPEESDFRKKIEYRIFSLFSTGILVFLLVIIFSFLFNLGNPLRSHINTDILQFSIMSFIIYLTLLFFSIHLSFSVKHSIIDTFIYGFLDVVFSILFIYCLGLSYFHLYF